MVPPASHRVSRVPWYSGTALSLPDFAYAPVTPFGGVSQTPSAIIPDPLWLPATPPCMHAGLGSLPFARRYLGDRSFFLFLRLLRCFSSAAYPRMTMDSSYGAQGLPVRVSPFGHLRINGYLLLPEAFRSLSRPSSALSAKASTLRPSCLTFCDPCNCLQGHGHPPVLACTGSGSRYMNECFVPCFRLEKHG